ncbi:MAG: acyl-CoA/acyl-ACP dehydrogenase [Actinobacteria bacterium]|nr:acyl-CoA/acyl-ACP dehydrogenase [Actinomycetota bacterium]MBU1943761.1 acyl-CoA/acyl-ACP dehydrogenase [Actinomycetota bacterium]MBU2688785.1 acyl-CoA/acyl-ACP dehydrogenase [Actinomycetota bacterium]
MDFGFTEEQELLRQSVREFCEAEISQEKVREWEETLDFMPQDLWDKMASLGFFSMSVPPEYGGEGGDMVTAMIGLEEISKASTAVALGVGATIGFGARPLVVLGTEEQKQEYLHRIARGELKFSLALTEPAGGTDILGAISTYADLDGEDYVINGQKIYITGAHVADYLTTVAITDRENPKRARALSIFMVKADTPGIEIRLIPKVSTHSCGSCEVFYSDVRVPAANLLGTLNNGWYDLLTTLNPERIGVAMMSVGVAEAVFDACLAYSREREAFGKPIGQFMVIQHYLADIAVGIENARNLVYKCAWLQDAGKPYHVEATMAGLYASKMALDAATVGMEIFGGYGVTMEADIQRYWRDSQQMVFSPISNEMSKNFIAQCYGLPRSY